MTLNDYNKESEKYLLSHIKPDKLYSMLPTALTMFGNLSQKKLIDVGCGDGFFSEKFYQETSQVIGIDNSRKQILKALEHRKGVEYFLADMNEFDYPQSDIIFAPFVLNYIQSQEKLEELLYRMYLALNSQGKLGSIIDQPTSLYHDNKEFGSIKRMFSMNEEEQIEIELYNKENLIATLYSYFHSKSSFDKILKKVGFREIEWINPVISPQGLNQFGKEYWNTYLKNLDIAYFVAYK